MKLGYNAWDPMRTGSRNILSVLFSAAGAALAVISISADLEPFAKGLKGLISMDGMLQFLPLPFFRTGGAVLGVCLFIIPWLSARAGRIPDGKHEVESSGDRRFILAAAGLALAAVLTVHWFAFRGMLLTPDEYAYLFQAELFASGRLWAAAHPLQEFFPAPFIVDHQERLFSVFPHGWSLILIPGVWAGAPWLLNPLIGALTLFLLYRMGLRHFDRPTARWAVVITLCSPFFLFNTATGFSHSSSLFLVMLILLLVLGEAADRPGSEGGRDSGSGRRSSPAAKAPLSLAIGLLSGMLAITHHLDLFFLVPALCYFTFRRFSLRIAVIRAACLALGLILPLALLFWLWGKQTGSPLITPISLYIPTTDFPGEVPADGSLFTFMRRREAIYIGIAHTTQWLLMLCLWIFPGAPLFMLPLLGVRKNTCDWIIIFGAAALGMGYFFYHSPGGWQYGPRFFYPVLPGLALLVARGIVRSPALAARIMRRPVRCSWLPMAAVSLILAGAVFTIGVGSFLRVLTTNLSRPMRAIHEAGAEPSILFLGFEEASHLTNATRNSPDFDDPVLVCRDLGAKNRALMDFYPDRSYFFLDAGNLQELGLQPEKVSWREVERPIFEAPDTLPEGRSGGE